MSTWQLLGMVAVGYLTLGFLGLAMAWSFGLPNSALKNLAKFMLGFVLPLVFLLCLRENQKSFIIFWILCYLVYRAKGKAFQ